MCLQGGDIEGGDGTAAQVSGGEFEDEAFTLAHGGRGVDGKLGPEHQRRSSFTLAAAPHLTAKTWCSGGSSRAWTWCWPLVRLRWTTRGATTPIWWRTAASPETSVDRAQAQPL